MKNVIINFLRRFFFPAAKEDLEPLATKEFVKEQVAELAVAVGEAFEKQDIKMIEMEERILYEFHALAENIHQDVAGANKDEISLIKDQKMPDHERRIARLEERVGV